MSDQEFSDKHLLMYWHPKNYRKDLGFGVGYNLNSDSKKFSQIFFGNTIWAFTRSGDKGPYVLAARLVAHGKLQNPPKSRYGKFRVWGDVERSRYYDIEEQAKGPSATGTFERLIRSFDIPTNAPALGASFEGLGAVKWITAHAHEELVRYSENLALEPRARLVPEEQLEALMFAGEKESIDGLIQAESPEVAQARKEYLSQERIRRNRDHVEDLRKRYRGQCQVCRWDPVSEFGIELCEGHHVRWISRGGKDELSNLVLLCPNHHRAIHRMDAVFDYSKQVFIFGETCAALHLSDDHMIVDEP